MKALKTVAVALGITLAALIVIPLDRPRRPLRLAEGHRGAGGRPARARSRRRLIDEPDRPPRLGARAALTEPATPAGSPAGVSVSRPPTRRVAGDSRSLVVMVLWAANFIVVKSALAVLPPVGFTFLRFVLASVTLLRPAPLAGGLDRPAAARPRRDLRARRPRIRDLPDPLDDRAHDDPGGRLGADHRVDAGPRGLPRGRRPIGRPHAARSSSAA